MSWDSAIEYPFDSVIHLLTLQEFATAWQNHEEIRVVNLFCKEDLEMLACSDFHEALTR